MKDLRRDGQTNVAQGPGATAGTPGKRTLIEQTVFAPTSIASGEGTGADVAPLPNAPTGDVENPLAGNGAIQNAPGKLLVTLSMPESAAPPLTFNATDYKDLYGQVSARVGVGEAGSVSTQLTTDTKTDASDNVTRADFTSPLKTMLPEWPQKGTQPAADQAKFDAWRGSVSAHEGQHRAIYKTEYAKLKTQVVGPKTGDVDTQATVVTDAAEKVQDAFDASSQPAPLAAPGGIEKVKSTDASDVTPAPDTANA